MNGRNGEPIVAEHNGYVGTAYGVSSYAIRDPRGREEKEERERKRS